MARHIHFANQFPAVDEPLRIVPQRTTFGEICITLRELDTYYQNGTRHEEGGKVRDLGTYVARAGGGKFKSANYLAYSPEELYRAPGFFQGHWNELRLFQKHDETKVTGRYPHKLGGHVRGKVLAGGKALEFRWSQGDGKEGGWYFDVVDDNTIKGVWWYDYGSRRQTREQVEKQVADGDLTHFDYFKRSRPYVAQEPEPLLKVPLQFEGVETPELFLWIPADELADELEASLRDLRTRRTEDCALLEISLDYNYRGVRHRSERYYAELPVPIDRKLEKQMASQLLYHRAWLLGSGVKTQEPGLEEELRMLGTILAPGQADFAAQPAFAEPFQAGKQAGLNDRKAVAESLIVRFASGGFLPSDANPFAGDSLLHLEFEIYRSLGALQDRDCVVEVYEHAPSDKKWPGRIWSLLPGYNSGLLGDFGDDQASAVRVPQGFSVEMYGEANQQGQQLKLGPGLHNLVARGFNDQATGIIVRTSSDPAAETDFRVRAYRKGRLLLRASQAGACSDGEHLPSELFEQARLVGLSSQDLEAIFMTSWAAATKQRQQMMVKTYASLGYGPSSKNPYARSGKKKLTQEFEQFLKLCADARFQTSLQEGQQIFKLFDRGLAVGKTSYSSAGSDDFIRQQADLGRIPVERARKHYQNGLQVGKSQHAALCSQLWFGSPANQKRFQEALVQVAGACAADPKLYGDHRDPQARMYGDGVWSPLRQLRQEARAAGVPAKTFIIARNRALRRLVPEATTSARLLKAAGSFFSEPVEWLGLTVYALLDTVDYGICTLAGWDTVPYARSEWYIEQCREYFSSSAFDRIDQASSGWGLYGMAVLGLGDAFLKVGAALTGWGALRNVGNLRAAGFTYQSFMQTLVVGGVEFTGGEVGKLLLRTVALSSVLGIGEEAIHAKIDGREFQMSGALWKTFRNSVMFLCFQGSTNFFTMLSMGETFAALVFLPQVAGLIATGSQLIEAYQTDDDKKKKEAWKYLAHEAFSTMLTMGVPAISRILARRFLASRFPKGGPLTKLAETIQSEAGVKLPEPDDAPAMVRFLLFNADNPQAMASFVKQQGSWKALQSKLQAQLPKNSAGKLTAAARGIEQRTLLSYLQTHGHDEKRLTAFLADIGAADGSWKALKQLGDQLPHSAHPLKPWKRGLTREGEAVWGRLVHQFLKSSSDDPAKALRLHGEVKLGGLRGLKRRLLKDTDGKPSDESIRIWSRLIDHLGDAGKLDSSHQEFGGYQLRSRMRAARKGVAWEQSDLHKAAAAALGKKTVSKQEAFDHFMARTKAKEIASNESVAKEINPHATPEEVAAHIDGLLKKENVLAFSHEDLGTKAVGLFGADDDQLVHVFGFHGIETGLRSATWDADFVMMRDPTVADGILIHHGLLFEMLSYAYTGKLDGKIDKPLKLYTCGAGWDPHSGIGFKTSQRFGVKTIAPGEELGTPCWSERGYFRFRWEKGGETIAKGRDWETSLPE